MSAGFDRNAPLKPGREAPNPAQITLPPRSGEQSRISRMLARVRDFGARLSARGRWIKQFLHDGR